MEKGFSFEVSHSTRYMLGMHAEYHHTLYELITDGSVATTTMLLKPELLAEWRSSIDIELMLSRNVRANEDTAALEELDTRRDSLVTYVFNRVRMAVPSPYASEQAAGKALQLVCDTYKGLQTEGYADETAHIRGLLLDLRLARNAVHVQTLQLGSVLDDLDQVNQQFAAIKEQRLDTAQVEKLPPAKVVRPQTDALLDRVLFFLQAAYLLSEVAADKSALATMADRVNFRIRDFRTRFNQSQAQKYGAGAGLGTGSGAPEGEGGSEIPEGGSGAPEGEGGTGTPEGGSGAPEGEGGTSTPEGGTGSESGNENEGDNTSGPGDTPTPPAPEGGGNNGGSDPDEEIIG